MKQFIKIALLVFYVFFNAGLSYSMHYCGDDFQLINLYGESKTCCESKAPMPGCCDDVSNLELPNTDEQQIDILDFQPLGIDYISIFHIESHAIVFGVSEKTTFSDSSPPIFQNTPIYIFCQVFLI
ncbi:hypothetical protein M3O96_15020 [Aquiflexum sp. TKW24L]|uniref:HYC_CC_PP family protein n=1 Tax=Aquiflexum sp. TKW24L TaxID=2942212 RepID=UPI0020C15AB8|nr:hypothetical protein [Aquiflexum sp. TKW24L]